MAPLVAIGASLLPSLIDLIAGDKAGKVAGAVADTVRQVAGTDDPVGAAAALADPAKAAELRVRLAEIALQTRQAELADIANARAQTVSLAQTGSGIAWAAPVISVVIVAGFFGCVAMLFMVQRTWDERTANLLNVLFGALIPGFAQVANYWLGSSAGSKRQGDAVREIATQRQAQQPTAIATTGDVSVAPSPPGTTADALNGGELARIRSQGA
ncbi:hypothetical protein [Roseomonas chloroacetimidivorans]|uniref:hypothetical protein n=1 Tax=Roseomonas chloroacetimidivorans TaxID=1766656 RepID=UPI003C793DB2